MIQEELNFNKAAAWRDNGIAVAELNAESHIPNWADMAFDALNQFIQGRSDEFMAEEVRTWATWVPEPPSARAWGSVILKAARRGIIRSVGIRKTRNPSAHCANASVWRAA